MKPYLELIRFYQPAGTLLLLWPPLWCLSLLTETLFPPVDLMIAFAFGAFLMRSAGCVINDITDREMDAKVERTKNRPLAAGTVPLSHAYILLAALLAGALLIAMQLGSKVVFASLLALPLIAAYPWMKRITFWPQLFLGITFNYGVLIASIAYTGSVQPTAWWLYAAAVFWTLGYDTIYGFQDMEDDEKIGVKSTSLLFKTAPKKAVGTMYALSAICFAISMYNIRDVYVQYMVLFCFVAPLFLQVWSLNIHNKKSCAELFKINGTAVGLGVFYVWVFAKATQHMV